MRHCPCSQPPQHFRSRPLAHPNPASRPHPPSPHRCHCCFRSLMPLLLQRYCKCCLVKGDIQPDNQSASVTQPRLQANRGRQGENMLLQVSDARCHFQFDQAPHPTIPQHPAVKGSTAGVAITPPCAMRARGGVFRSHCPSTAPPCTLPVLLPPKPHRPPWANSGVICSCRSPLISAIAAMQRPPLSAAAAAAAAAMLQARMTLLRRSADRDPAWQEPRVSRPGGEHRCCCCCC